MTTTTALDLSSDLIDVRDLIARVEELEGIADDPDMLLGEELGDELDTLLAILADLQGVGGDEQWRGDWYPVTLIRDSYFRTYAEELADDCGLIPKDAQWPLTCIDWDKAASELQWDYSSVDIDGVTYWTR